MSNVNSASNDRNYTQMINNPDYRANQASKFNAVFQSEEKEGVSFQDFFNLMIMQVRHQDFLNPMDDSQYLTQLAQIASMKAMEEISYYNKANYAMSYLGKEVTAAKNAMGGNVNKDTGVVTQVALMDGDYQFTVNGKVFSMKEIMLVHDTPTGTQNTENKPETENKKPDYSMTNLALSYVGKDVSAWKDGLETTTKEVGTIDSVRIVDGEYKFSINGILFSFDEIRIVHNPAE